MPEFPMACIDQFRREKACVLWSLHTVDHYRLNAILPQVEAPAFKGPNSEGAVGMHEACLVLTFHYRASSGKPF